MSSQYTWTFSERSLLIKLFCWVYAPDREAMSFCKLFWGTLLFPITIPLRILGSIAYNGGRATGWAFMHSGIPWAAKRLADAHIDHRESAVKAREERRIGWHVANYGFLPGSWDTVTEPQPDWSAARTKGFLAAKALNAAEEKKAHQSASEPQPNVPTRLANSAAEQADRISAFLQAHPGFGNGFARAGKVVVRGVFYPIMILVPIAAFTWAGYEIFQHWHGPIDTARGAGTFLGYWALRILKIAGISLGLVVASVASVAVFVTGGALLVRVTERIWPYNEDKMMERLGAGAKYWDHRPDLRERGDYERPMWQPSKALYSDSWYIVSHRWTHRLAPVGRVAVLPFRAIRWAVVAVFMILWWIVAGAASGAVGAGKFMIEGHHMVKDRTCPRIEILEEAKR